MNNQNEVSTAPAAPPVPPFTGKAPEDSYDLAKDFRPDALVAALAELDSFARGVEEYVEANEAHVNATEFDLEGDDQMHEAQLVLAQLLCDGGRLNDEGWLAWFDSWGEQVFAWSIEEVIAKADPAFRARLVERFPDEVAVEVARA